MQREAALEHEEEAIGVGADADAHGEAAVDAEVEAVKAEEEAQGDAAVDAEVKAKADRASKADRAARAASYLHQLHHRPHRHAEVQCYVYGTADAHGICGSESAGCAGYRVLTRASRDVYSENLSLPLPP